MLLERLSRVALWRIILAVPQYQGVSRCVRFVQFLEVVEVENLE